MIHDLVPDLCSVGFSEKEARVYVALLVTGKASASEVATQTGVTRSSAYDTLEHLEEKGFITSLEIDGARHYQAEDPTRLLALLTLQENEVARQKEKAQTFLPRLMALYQGGDSERPGVRYFAAREGLARLREDVAKSSDDIIEILGYDAFCAVHDETDTAKHRTHLGATSRRIRSIILSREKHLPNLPASADTLIIPPEIATAPGEMIVFGSTVILLSYDGSIMAVEIRSPAIAATCRATLELAWREAKRIREVLGDA